MKECFQEHEWTIFVRFKDPELGIRAATIIDHIEFDLCADDSKPIVKPLTESFIKKNYRKVDEKSLEMSVTERG